MAEDDLRARAREFSTAMGDGEVVFASKAFPCTAVLRVFHEEGLSVDVASGGELALAQQAGFTGRRIILHGNAKSESELERPPRPAPGSSSTTSTSWTGSSGSPRPPR